jgi:hypothetical protein
MSQSTLTLPLTLHVTHLGDGHVTEVLVGVGEQTSSIAAVAQRISELEGIEASRVYLFRVGDDGIGGAGSRSCCLDDGEVLRVSCELFLLVGATRFAWDCASPLIVVHAIAPPDDVFRSHYYGLYDIVNAKTVRRAGCEFNDSHNMRILPRMRVLPRQQHNAQNAQNANGANGEDGAVLSGDPSAPSEVFSISLKFTRPVKEGGCSNGHNSMRPDTVVDHYVRCGITLSEGTMRSDGSWGLPYLQYNDSGSARVFWKSLAYRGTHETQTHFGSVITMQFDSANHTLRFLVDGKQHGPDRTIPTAPTPHAALRPAPSIMQWVVEAPWTGTLCEIVDAVDTHTTHSAHA